DLIKEMGHATSRGNMPISSNTDDEYRSEGPCQICGRESICGGLGYVRVDLPVGHADFGKLFRCPNNVTADPERKEKLRKIGNLDAFIDKTFEEFNTDLPMLTPPQRASLEMALRVAQTFAHQPDGWLLLEGTYGCG